MKYSVERGTLVRSKAAGNTEIIASNAITTFYGNGTSAERTVGGLRDTLHL